LRQEKEFKISLKRKVFETVVNKFEIVLLYLWLKLKMLRTIHKILTGLMIALGLVHIFFTLHDYNEFSLQALWFASAGVAIVLAGFLNIVLLRDVGKDKVVRLLAVVTNIIFPVMFSVASYLMQQPQVFIGIGLFVAATIIAILFPQTQN
jgi:hypothetical protein